MADTNTAAEQLIDLVFHGDAAADDLAALLHLIGRPTGTASSVDAEEFLSAMRDARSESTALFDHLAQIARSGSDDPERQRVAAHIVATSSLWGAAATLIALAAGEDGTPLAVVRRYSRDEALANIAALQQLADGFQQLGTPPA